MRSWSREWRCFAARTVRGVLVAVLTLTVSGCATNPYIGDTRPARPAPDSAQGPKNVSLAYARRHADNTIDAYARLRAAESARQQQLNAGLLTLGAAGLGAAVLGAHKDTLIVGALLGALGYQLGTWNVSKARPDIYSRGEKALACAKTTVPEVTPDQLALIRQRSTALLVGIDEAGKAQGEVTHRLADAQSLNDPAPLHKAAQAEMSAVERDLRTAHTALARAQDAQRTADNAGALLDAAVDDVKQAVANRISATEADPTMILGAIARIPEVAAQIIPLSDDTIKTALAGARRDAKATAQSAGPNAESLLAKALGALREQRARLQARTSDLRGAANVPSVAQLKKQLTACVAEVSKGGSGAIAVDPPTIEVPSGTNAHTTVPISGGTLPYSASLEIAPTKGLDAKAVGNEVLVTFTTDAVPGSTHRVRVRDATGGHAILTVQVKGKEPAEAKDEPPANPASKPKNNLNASSRLRNDCSGYKGRSAVEICLVQAVVETDKKDGRFGAETCTKLKEAWQPILGRTGTFDGVFSNEVMNAIKTKTGLAEAANDDAIRAKLSERNVNCRRPRARSPRHPRLRPRTLPRVPRRHPLRRRITVPSSQRVRPASCRAPSTFASANSVGRR